MKKLIAKLCVLILSTTLLLPVSAADGKVTYDGNSREFIFEPGSTHSPTDLFPDFKGVMTGDTLTQKITVKNDASNDVKVEIYIRSLGANEGSADFLSKLGLQVKKSEENEMAYMFDSTADKTAQLTDWVCLGTLYSGGEVNLDVLLKVPLELDNDYQSKIGYLDWEFMIKEYPIGETDPKPPQTGNNFNLILWSSLTICSASMILILLFWKKKEQKEQQTTNTQN